MAANHKLGTVAVDETILDRLDVVLSGTGRSRTEAVEEAVTSYIRELEYREAGIEEALADLETGYAHSGEQIFAWMDRWASGEYEPPPEPDIVPATAAK